MSASIQSLIDSGTKLYLDSVEPSEVDQNLAWGAVGATSNPAIISAIVARGGLDEKIESLLAEGQDDEAIAWALTEELVQDAQDKFADTFKATGGNAGYVSFELDPVLEDPDASAAQADTSEKYIELGKHFAKGHTNRMIKVPATRAGLGALEELAAAGVTLNVTLIFTDDQYHRRPRGDLAWRQACRRRWHHAAIEIQIGLFDFHLADRRLHQEIRAAALRRRPGPSRYRQRQTNLGGEPEILG